MDEILSNLAKEANRKKDCQSSIQKPLSIITQSKKNLKKRKWISWKTQNESICDNIMRSSLKPLERIKRRKCVLLLAYSGAKYFGMQRNPGMETIEEQLFKAMMKHKWITEEGFEQAQYTCFQRAARTDKGVSAARQVCSIKLPGGLNISALNLDLPKDIHIFAIQRVTKGFNAKDQCNARTYTYTLPTIAFADKTQKHNLDYRINTQQLQKVQNVLQMYQGTKNFHNFTSKRYVYTYSTIPTKEKKSN